jgi:hypothetical protein
MEPTQIKRSDQKRLDKVWRVRVTIEKGESLFLSLRGTC